MTEIQPRMPKVSILIPVFNRKDFIAECIQSALDQTFTDLEVVVVDNVSTDGTWEICQHFAAQDQRVRVFRNDSNIGPVRNWLRCVGEAQGAYGKILFSDDLMFPKFIENTLHYLEDPDVAFVSTAALIGETPDDGVVFYATPIKLQRISSDRYFNFLMSNKRDQIPYSPCAAIFRMTDIRANLHISIPTKIPRDFSKNGAGPDVLLFALTALNYKTVVMLSQAEVFFRAHAGSFTELDSGNEVTQGYRAAFAWFCKNKLTKKHWARYVAHLWWLDVKKKRRLFAMRAHGLRYEGNGNFKEVKRLLMWAIVVVALDFPRFIHGVFKKILMQP